MSKNELCIMTVKGKDYEIVDATGRTMIAKLNQEIQLLKEMIDTHKQGILELAQQTSALKQNETVRRNCLSVQDVKSFPILKFNTPFSILVDISIICDNDLFISQQILKYCNGKIYRNVLNDNCTIDCYYQLVNDNIYIFFDTYHSVYDLSFNVISYDGEVPKFKFDDEKFSTSNYANAIKIK